MTGPGIAETSCLCDRALDGTEAQPRALHGCFWITTILGAVGATAALATSAAGSISKGLTPWDDPADWFLSDAKALGLSAAGGAVGSAVGPALGAAGDAVGIGANTGTVAAEAGAATPQALGGTVSRAASSVLQNAGTQAPLSVIKNAAASAISGAGSGALRDLNNPGRGALMGAAGGLASAGAGYAANNIAPVLRGAGASFVDMAPRTATMMPSGGSDIMLSQPSGHFSLMNPGSGYNPSTSQMTLSAPTAPTFGSRAANFATQAAPRLAGGAARQMVGSALTPRPPDPNAQNPYVGTPYRSPYWAGGSRF